MKTTFHLTLLLLFCSISVFAQNEASVDITSFKTLTVKGSFNIILQTGEPYLHFENGQDNNVKVENKNGVLSIIQTEEVDGLSDLYINSPKFININVGIKGDLTVKKNVIQFSTLNFNANVQGKTKLNLNGEIFVGNFSDCGKITITGAVDQVYLNLYNSEDLHITKLKAGSSSIKHND